MKIFKEKKVHIYIKIISILLFKVKESYFDFHLYTRCVPNIIMINISDLYIFHKLTIVWHLKIFIYIYIYLYVY